MECGLDHLLISLYWICSLCLGLARWPTTRLSPLCLGRLKILCRVDDYAQFYRFARTRTARTETLRFVRNPSSRKLICVNDLCISSPSSHSLLDLSIQLWLCMPTYYHRSASLQRSSYVESHYSVSRKMALLSHRWYPRAMLGHILTFQFPRSSWWSVEDLQSYTPRLFAPQILRRIQLHWTHQLAL